LTLRTTSPETQGSSSRPRPGPLTSPVERCRDPSPLELRRAQESRAAIARNAAPQRPAARARAPPGMPAHHPHPQYRPAELGKQFTGAATPGPPARNRVLEPLDKAPLTLVSAETLCAGFHKPSPRKRALMPPTGYSWIAVALAFRLLFMPPGLEDGLPDGRDADRPGAWRPQAIRARDGRQPGIIQRGPGTSGRRPCPGTSRWTRPIRSRLAEAREGAVARPSGPCYRAPVTLSDTGG
jgi:hypothetical protein